MEALTAVLKEWRYVFTVVRGFKDNPTRANVNVIHVVLGYSP